MASSDRQNAPRGRRVAISSDDQRHDAGEQQVLRQHGGEDFARVHRVPPVGACSGGKASLAFAGAGAPVATSDARVVPTSFWYVARRELGLAHRLLRERGRGTNTATTMARENRLLAEAAGRVSVRRRGALVAPNRKRCANQSM